MIHLTLKIVDRSTWLGKGRISDLEGQFSDMHLDYRLNSPTPENLMEADSRFADPL